tara:strand:+ start:723 stop:1262 length:540 start_codon:yes stop_codon:yes gene_type:complete
MEDTLIPDYVDARKIFAQQLLIKGTIPVSRLTRFCELVASTQGDVQVKMKFDLDESKRRIIEGELDTQAQVICQRCLEPMQIALHDEFRLAVVNSEAQSEKLPKSLDPWICEDIKLVLAQVIEEQLILCMPIVSYHDNDCIEKLSFEATQPKHNGTAKVANGAGKPNPFDILKTLKDKD